MASATYNFPSSSPPYQSAQQKESVSEAEDEDLLSASGAALSEHLKPEARDQGTESETDNYQTSKQPKKTHIRRRKRAAKHGSVTPPKKTSFGAPASTWRSWTAADRAIATSLDQLTSQDLSLHLYNAHALKQRAHLIRQHPKETDLDQKVWEPPKIWTAWPLPSECVPRERYRLWEEDESDEELENNVKDPTRAAADIEDILIGVVLKTARDKFLEEYPPDGAGDSASSTSSLESEDSDTNVSHHSDTEMPRSLYSSNSATNPAQPQYTPEPKSLKHVVMADDALATSILLPTICHILSKLDNLLMGLHHGRQASLRINYSSPSETQTDAHVDALCTGKSPRPKDAKRGRPPHQKPQSRTKKKGKAKANSSAQSSTSKYSILSSESDSEFLLPLPKRRRRQSSSRSRTRSPLSVLKLREARLGLRDWSDVLGIAAMQGWDRRIIDKAAERCAALFGEGMDFRTIGEEGVEVMAYLPTGKVIR